MKKKTSKTKRKLKLRNFFLLCSFLVLFFGIFFYMKNLPIRNIIILGNTYLSDQEIIEVAGIKHYPKLFEVRSKTIREDLLKLDYVSSVQVHKNLLGRITIEIIEEVPAFYNRNREKLVFLSGKEISSQELHGVPILINYVPDEIYERMLKCLNDTNYDVLKLISEIEYQPWKSDDVMIDDTRFYLRMNDGNVVYVNLINWDKLNNYMTIYSTLGSSKGTLQLDSSLGNGITFTPF